MRKYCSIVMKESYNILVDKVKSLIESIEKQKIKVLEAKTSGNRTAWNSAQWILDKLERDLKKLKRK